MNGFLGSAALSQRNWGPDFLLAQFFVVQPERKSLEKDQCSVVSIRRSPGPRKQICVRRDILSTEVLSA